MEQASKKQGRCNSPTDFSFLQKDSFERDSPHLLVIPMYSLRCCYAISRFEGPKHPRTFVFFILVFFWKTTDKSNVYGLSKLTNKRGGGGNGSSGRDCELFTSKCVHWKPLISSSGTKLWSDFLWVQWRLICFSHFYFVCLSSLRINLKFLNTC